MFERFTDRARRVLVEAQAESAENKHGFLGTEHILIGIMRAGEGLAHDVLVEHGIGLEPLRSKIAARLEEWVDPKRDELTQKEVLAAIGIDLDVVRSRVEAVFGPGALPDPDATPPFTPKAKDSVERAFRRAQSLRQRYIGTEHVLLGVLEIRDGVACQALLDLGVNLDEVDAATVRRAAPEEARMSEASLSVVQLQRAVAGLPAEKADPVKPALSELGRTYGEAIRSEQAEVARLAAATAEKLEAAVAAARAALARAGVAV